MGEKALESALLDSLARRIKLGENSLETTTPTLILLCTNHHLDCNDGDADCNDPEH
jgi:hypothetical protein